MVQVAAEHPPLEISANDALGRDLQPIGIKIVGVDDRKTLHQILRNQARRMILNYDYDMEKDEVAEALRFMDVVHFHEQEFYSPNVEGSATETFIHTVAPYVPTTGWDFSSRKLEREIGIPMRTSFVLGKVVTSGSKIFPERTFASKITVWLERDYQNTQPGMFLRARKELQKAREYESRDHLDHMIHGSLRNRAQAAHLIPFISKITRDAVEIDQ